MSVTIEDLLSRSRASATNEERVVLALEAIADRLRDLMPLLAPRNGDSGADCRQEVAGLRNEAASQGAWENEGGSLDHDPLADLGITRSQIEEFEVGGYHYTDLANAIAQAHRLRPAHVAQPA